VTAWRPSAPDLSRIGPFVGCSRRALGRIEGSVREWRVAQDRVVCREADEGHTAFVILGGVAIVHSAGVELARLGPGALFGEMALLQDGRRTATVTAGSALRLLVLEQHDFEVLIASSPVFARRVAALLAGRLRRADHSLGAAACP
jgi:CRP-like cAMP-binding protein